MKSGSLNLLHPSEPVQACTGIALPSTWTQVYRTITSKAKNTVRYTVWRTKLFVTWNMTVLFTMQALTHTHTHTHTTHTHTHTHAPATEWYMPEDLGDDKKTNWISETRDGLGGLIYVAQYKDRVLHWTHPTSQHQIKLIAVINILLTYGDWGLHNACWSRDKSSEIWHHVS